MTFGTKESFVEALEEYAAEYTAKAKAIEALPVVRDLRLALNVAAADMRPLVVVRGEDAGTVKKLEAAVAKLAWSPQLIGQAHYVVLGEEDVTYEGLAPEFGVTVVQPDPYGMGGEVLAHVEPDAKASLLSEGILAGVEAHEREPRDHDDHVREARRKGIRWEPEVPVTDDHGDRRGR